METVTIEEIITVKDLAARWIGLTDEELANIIALPPFLDPDLVCYLHKKTTVSVAGDKTHYCYPEPSDAGHLSSLSFPHHGTLSVFSDWKGNEGGSSFGIVFDLKNVEAMEVEHPEYLDRIVRLDEINDSQQKEKTEWISCETLSDRWKCSPFDVVAEIRRGSLVNRLNEESPNTILQHDTLDNFSIHSRDLDKYENYHAGTNMINDVTLSELLGTAAIALDVSTLASPLEAVVGLLELVEGQRNEIKAKSKSKYSKGSTTNVEYCISRVPDIVATTWKVKEKWDALEDNHEFKTKGIPHAILMKWIGDFTNRDILNAVKRCLVEKHEVKFREKN